MARVQTKRPPSRPRRRRPLVALALIVLVAGLAATISVIALIPEQTRSRAVRLRPVDGGPGYYARFSNPLPSDESYFPIGVWLESVTSAADISADRAAGLNLYVGLTANSNLPLIDAGGGMKVIAQHDEWGDRGDAPGSRAIAGWMLADEIDMMMRPGRGYATLRSHGDRVPADDDRLRYNNYGKGVTFWNTNRQAGRFVNGFQDVVSADNYWFTDNNICGPSEGSVLVGNGRSRLDPTDCRRAANYGRTVERVRRLVTPAGSRPVWNFVEVGHPFTEARWPSIKPAEVSAAVWSGLIAGARGVVYFNHSFGGPAPTQHALREPAYAAVRSEVTRTNARIRRLAPVLNAPFVDGLVKTRAGVDWMAKYAGGKFWIFAGSRAAAAQRARFRIPCTGDATVTVVDENRTLALADGAFEDSFADGNASHVYRIDGGSTCGLPSP